MTESRLQELLTKRWLVSGIDVDDEKLLLVAWEVMFPSWEINDAAVRWNEPSIDFLAMDGSGQLVAIELKVKVPGRKPAWAALCQVTHRALCIARTDHQELLKRAHDDCIRGEHGRIGGLSGGAASLGHRFRRMFGTELHESLAMHPVRRVLAATAFGPSYEATRQRFNETSFSRVLRDLATEYPTTRGQAAREFKRLRETLPISASELATPVETLLIDDAASPLSVAADERQRILH